MVEVRRRSMSNTGRSIAILGLAACLALGACGGGNKSESTVANDAAVSDDPFGATGAPGADLTDNGATDGANGMADGNAMNVGSADVDANAAERANAQ
jgi:hypothetical protein